MGIRQGVVVGMAAAALGVLVASPLAGTAAVLPQHRVGTGVGMGAPGLTVPSVTVPSVTVPSVSTPVGTTPSVTTPRTTTPTVTVAPVPSISVPSVTTPRVSTPVATVPSVTTPSVGAPSAAAAARTTASKVSALVGGATHSAQVSGAPGDPASAAPDPATSPAPTAATAAPGTATASGLVASRARAAAAHGRTRTASQRSAPARRSAAAHESRQLRRLVARLHGCLGVLQVGARRLLTLRAGLHGPARGAAATARILRVSPRREAALERRAMAALRRSVTTGCAGPSGAVTAAGAAPTGTRAPSSSTAGASPSESGPSASLSAVHASRPPRGGRAAHTPSRPAPRIVDQAETGSSVAGILVPALLALLSALALVALPEVRRRLRPAAEPSGPRYDSASIPTPAAPIAHTPVAEPRNDAARVPSTRRTGASRTGMDRVMAQMAIDVFAEMADDMAGAVPHGQPEADTSHPQVQVEHEHLPRDAPAPRDVAQRRPQAWAREHATQVALVITVALGWLARLTRRGRRRRRRSG